MTYKPTPGMTDRQIQKAVAKAAMDFEDKCKTGYSAEKITLQGYFERWLTIKDNEREIKTMHHYRQLTDRIYPELGHIRLDKLTPMHIQEFYSKLATTISERTGKLLSKETQLHYHRLLSSVLRDAYKLQVIDRDIMSRVTAPKADKPTKRILDDAQSKRFVAALLDEPDIRKKMALLLLIFLGCRIGELLGLEWTDINYQDCAITINRASQYVGRQTITTTPKNETSIRTVSLPAELFPLIREYRAFWVDYSQYVDINHNRLFIQKDNGKPIFISTINKWLKKFLEDNGLPIVSVHSLRHTNITLQVLNGVPLRQVSARAGHATMTTTANIYSHALQSADKAAADKLGEVLPLVKLQ